MAIRLDLRIKLITVYSLIVQLIIFHPINSSSNTLSYAESGSLHLGIGFRK